MGNDLGIPAKSHADNIIADFRVDLLLPNAVVAFSTGPQSQTLESNLSQICNKLAQIIRDTDPNAENAVQNRKIVAYIIAIIFIVIFLVIAISIDTYVVLGAGSIVVLGCYAAFTIWSRNYGKIWREKVVPKILNYCKNEFKETYQNIGIHVLYPINRYSNNQVSAIWMVIRLTNGPLQQPSGGPTHWSSDGNVTQTFPVVNIQQPQQIVQQQQQQNNMQQQQQQLQQMVQQQQQQIQQLQQLVQNQQQQQIVSSEPQNENQEGVRMDVQQTQEIKHINNDSNVNSTQETTNYS